jgi:hypothetical protein
MPAARPTTTSPSRCARLLVSLSLSVYLSVCRPVPLVVVGICGGSLRWRTREWVCVCGGGLLFGLMQCIKLIPRPLGNTQAFLFNEGPGPRKVEIWEPITSITCTY